MSSTASILSGRSFGSRRITLRVDITVEYDGPSLSDTSSLASLDDFKIVNSSQQLLSFGTSPIEVDDDSVTVSSRDPGLAATQTLQTSQRSISKQKSSQSCQTTETLAGDVVNGQPTEARKWAEHEFDVISIENEILSVSERFPSDPSAVFERLKISETLADKPPSVESDRLAASDRGAAWLRDQNERAIRSKLGTLPELSDSESFSLSLDESLGGDLALQRDPRGRYYYSYTIGSSASQAHGSVYDEGQQSNAGVSVANSFPRPTSLHLNWLASQRIEVDISSSETSDGFSVVDLGSLLFQSPPEDALTDCSNCGVLLDAIRYVCSTCGPKPTVRVSTSDKGKDKEDSPVTAYAYSPSSHTLFSSPNFSTSQTIIATASSYDKPLPSLPSSLPSTLRPHSSGSRMHLNVSSAPSSPTRKTNGYELCVMCLESVGINHAINEAGLAEIGSPNVSNMSPTSHRDPHLASQWRRAAPKKGQMRHAYKEKVWSQCGWEDVGTHSPCCNKFVFADVL